VTILAPVPPLDRASGAPDSNWARSSWVADKALGTERARGKGRQTRVEKRVPARTTV